MKRLLLEVGKGDVYPEVGSKVWIEPYDFLVTTPLSHSIAAAEEADAMIKAYRDGKDVGFYLRGFNPNSPLGNLRIDSRLWYVDQRAIRGFLTVTDLVEDEFVDGFGGVSMGYGLFAKMAGDTWRWVTPIPCDYNWVKPPQGYTYARKHEYFRGIGQVKII